jgi:hypothetical protein|tara:strand:- start:51 stop:593 length:543 start_codon:yes stop_codon:yes gene_type:complete
MSGNKLSHYFPNNEWAWMSEGDYATLQWFGPDEKPTEAELDALEWPLGLYPDTQSARAAMLGFIERLTDQVTSQYPKAEVSAWPSKAEAARAVIADTARADQVLLIQDEADIVGATLADQAAAIVSNASVFEAIVAKVSGLRQATDKALLLATTSAEREAVLDAATIQATEMATAYGLIA